MASLISHSLNPQNKKFYNFWDDHDPNFVAIVFRKNYGQSSEKVEGGHSEGWFLACWKYRPPWKKAWKSDVYWGPFHGEIGILKSQILFSKNLCPTCLLQILGSFRRVQLVPFSFLNLFTNVSFAWIEIIMFILSLQNQSEIFGCR